MAYKKRKPTFKYAKYAGQDSDYLPGEVYGSSFSSYQKTPQEMLDYRVNQMWDFPMEDAPDQSKSFETFLTLSKNPNALIGSQFMNLPSGFVKAMNMG
tara:strand:- start:1188 stop:1481 length:294 start_codon:yes stop_codon:yes gene_type:complete